MTTHLSTRAFKFLRKISRKTGLEKSDEEIHDIGTRLLCLCHVATNAKVREEKRHETLLTDLAIIERVR